VRRLTGDDDLTSEFATTWRTYELDAKTRSLLEYAEKLTKTPGMIDDGDIDALRTVGWSEDAIYEASALISFFNFSGRMEAASGLPADEVPASARPPEARVAAGGPRWRRFGRSSVRSGSDPARTSRPRA
jgi:uncharacterized protein YciW